MPRKKKDPDMPKRPLSSYMFYSKERRPKIQEEQPSLQFGEYSRIIADEWKSLDEEAKEKYLELSQKDKERYEEELKVYKEKKKNEPPPPTDFEMNKNFTAQDRVHQHQTMQMRQQNQMAAIAGRQGSPARYAAPYGQFANQYGMQMAPAYANFGAMNPSLRQQQQQQNVLRGFNNQQAQYFMQQQQQNPEAFAGRIQQMSNSYYTPASYQYQQQLQQHQQQMYSNYDESGKPHHPPGQQDSNSRPRSNQGNENGQSPQMYNPQYSQANFRPGVGFGMGFPPGMQAAYMQQRGGAPVPYGYPNIGFNMGYQGNENAAQAANANNYNKQIPKPPAEDKEENDEDNIKHTNENSFDHTHDDGGHLGEEQYRAMFASQLQRPQHGHGQMEPWMTWDHVDKSSYGIVFICGGEHKGNTGFYKQDDAASTKAIVHLQDTGEVASIDISHLRRPPTSQQNEM